MESENNSYNVINNIRNCSMDRFPPPPKRCRRNVKECLGKFTGKRAEISLTSCIHILYLYYIDYKEIVETL